MWETKVESNTQRNGWVKIMAKAIRELEKHGIEDAISTGYGILEELGQELRDWYDSLPDSLQGGDKGSALDEGASTLEDLSAVEVSEELAKVLTGEIVTVSPMKKRASRAARRDYAVTLLSDAKQTIEDFLSNQDDDYGHKDDLEQLMSDLDEAIGEAENVSFPGMYG